ncbi:hypothetical protein GQ457_17G002240 [Hibiscus cannabinus]
MESTQFTPWPYLPRPPCESQPSTHRSRRFPRLIQTRFLSKPTQPFLSTTLTRPQSSCSNPIGNSPLLRESSIEPFYVLNNIKTNEFCASLTSFDWNDVEPKRIETSSIGTTCTIWDIEKSIVETQLIAHVKEVYDIAWGEKRVVFVHFRRWGQISKSRKSIGVLNFLLFQAFCSPSSVASAAMVLEATMICIDNSEWMRNGDYSPSRFQAQADAVSLICGAKTQSNPENTVGILTMAGKGVRVLATPTSDLGKILSCMHGLEMGGETNLAAGILIAQLALKHRQNKNQQQRIIVFAGSPIKHERKALEIIGKKLKKNSVALDIVNFGEEEDGKPEKLEALLGSVNNNDTSHMVHVPPGQNALSDVLISTPVFTGDGEGGSGFAAAAAAAAAAGGVSDFDFGVDPNIDPELALALRVSMEEERARQEAAAKKAAEEAQPQSDSQNATSTATEKVSDQMDEDDLLKQAVALSMNIPGSDSSAGDAQMSEATNDDQELALALQMSMQDGSKDSSAPSDVSKVLGDQSFMSSILSSLPGVDPNDPNVKDLLASLPGQSESQEKKDEDEQPKDDK